MQYPLDSRPQQGPWPSSTTTEEIMHAPGSRGGRLEQRCTTEKCAKCGFPQPSLASSPSLQRRHSVGPLPQAMRKDGAGTVTRIFDTGSYGRETAAYENQAGTCSAVGALQRATCFDQRRGWPCVPLPPSTPHVSPSDQPHVARSAAGASVTGGDRQARKCGCSQAQFNLSCSESGGGIARVNSADSRNVCYAASGAASHCANAFLPGTLQREQSGERFRQEWTNTSGQAKPPLHSVSCDGKLHFDNNDSSYPRFASRGNLEKATSALAPDQVLSPLIPDAQNFAALNAHEPKQKCCSSVAYPSTMCSTACTTSILNSAFQSGASAYDVRKETTSTSCGSGGREASFGSQDLSRSGSISSAVTSLTRSGSMSASTAAWVSPARQSICSTTQAPTPSVSCSLDVASFGTAWQMPSKHQGFSPMNSTSFDAASFGAAWQTPSKNQGLSSPVNATSFDAASFSAAWQTPSKNQGMSSPVNSTAPAASQPSSCSACLVAAANDDGHTPITTTGLCSTTTLPKHLLSSASDTSTAHKDLEAAVPSTSTLQPARNSVSDVSVTSRKQLDASEPVLAEFNTSDIVLSCGLPSPESCAPVSLACRVLMRRYATAAAAARERATQDANTERKGGGEINKHLGPIKHDLGFKQFEDCGWPWQEDGGGILLLRLQRKQLDKGKVKSSGYEAFGRAYGLSTGTRVTGCAPWDLVFTNVDTSPQKDAFRRAIAEIRRHFADAASAEYTTSGLNGASCSTVHNRSSHPCPNAIQCGSAQSSDTGVLRGFSVETRGILSKEPASTGASPCQGSTPFSNSLAGNSGFSTRGFAARDSSSNFPMHESSSKEDAVTWSAPVNGGVKDSGSGRSLGAGHLEDDVETRHCECCGDQREKLVGCTRSASLLETRADGVCKVVELASLFSSALQQPLRVNARGRPLALGDRDHRAQTRLTEARRRKHLLMASYSNSGKRHSTCEGRLQGWHAQQLSVRIILRNSGLPVAETFNRDASPVAARRRLRKRVTFSLDCFSSDGETTPGLLCRLSPPRTTPFCESLFSKVPNSTCCQAGDLSSRSRSECSSVATSEAPGGGEGRETAAIVAGEGSMAYKRKKAALVPQTDTCTETSTNLDKGEPQTGHEQNVSAITSSQQLRGNPKAGECPSAEAISDEEPLVREESFYVLLGRTRPTVSSRWTRRGRTVVCRNSTRYSGPLLPLVIGLLEREREAVRRGNEKALNNDILNQIAQQHTDTQSSWPEKPVVTTVGSPQQKNVQRQPEQSHKQHLELPHQSQNQQGHRPLLNQEWPTVSQRQLPQQRQAAPQHAQSFHSQLQQKQQLQQQQPQCQQVQQQQFPTQQEGTREIQHSQAGRKGAYEQHQEHAAAKKKPAVIHSSYSLPRQGCGQTRNGMRISGTGNRRPRECILLQPLRASCTHVGPGYHHPLDTPETLFPRARARQLRRLLMQQSGTDLSALDDPRVLASGLPLLQGRAGAAGTLGEVNLAAYQQLNRCSAAARAAAMAGSTGRLAGVPQGSGITLQHQHSGREKSYSSPYSLPEATPATHGWVPKANTGFENSVGISPSLPGLGYRRGLSGPIGPLRQAASCSFAFDYSGGENRAGIGRRGTSGAAAGQQSQGGLENTDDEDEEEDAEDEEEEEDFRSRFPRLFRRRRNSDCMQPRDGIKEYDKVPRFSLLSRSRQQDGRYVQSRVTAGERLKRLLVPLFFKNHSACSADVEGKEERSDKDEDTENAVATTTNRDVELRSTRVTELAEDEEDEEEDDEDLWVTESDASTPPPSAGAVIEIEPTPVDQQNSRNTSASKANEGNPQTGGSLTSSNTTTRKVLHKSLTDYLGPVTPLEQRRRRNLEQMRLRRGHPEALARKRVAKEFTEEVESPRTPVSRMLTSAKERDADSRDRQVEIAMPASEQKTKGATCGNEKQVVVLKGEQLTSLQRPPRSIEVPKQVSTPVKQVDEKESPQRKYQGQPQDPQLRTREDGQTRSREERMLAKTGATAQQEKVPMGELIPLREMARCQPSQQATERHQPQHADTEEQQQLETKQQREQHPEREVQQVSTDGGLPREQRRSESEEEAAETHDRTAQCGEKEESKRKSLEGEKSQKQGLDEELAGRPSVGIVKGVQKDEKSLTRPQHRSIGGNDIGNTESEAILTVLTTLTPLSLSSGVDREGSSVKSGEKPNRCGKLGPERRCVQEIYGNLQTGGGKQANPAPRLSLSSGENAISEACAQQPASEKGLPKQILVTTCPPPKSKTSTIDGRSRNEQDTVGAIHGAPRWEPETEGTRDSRSALYPTASQEAYTSSLTGEKREPEARCIKGNDGTCGISNSGSRELISDPMTPAACDEEVASAGSTLDRTPSAGAQVFYPNLLRSDEPNSASVRGSNRTRPRGGLRWRWRRSNGRARDFKAAEREECLPSLDEVPECFRQFAGPPSPTTVPMATVVSAAESTTAALNEAPMATLCNTDQVASSTAEGSQQTVSSPLHSRRSFSKRNSLLTAFDQCPAQWSTRGPHDDKDEPRSLPTLLQRLSTRLRRKRDSGACDPGDTGSAQCVPDME